MKATVIISVYNHFEWLRLILDALRMQTYKDFEVVIADDGSSAQTVDAIRSYIAQHPELKIIHSWHPDRGWRKNLALNEAVRKSTGEYLIFMDGDCIPHRKFVEDHIRLARPGFVVGGRRVETGPNLSKMLESWQTLPKRYFGKARLRILRSIFSEPIGDILAQFRRTLHFPFFGKHAFGMKIQGILGANFGISRKDLEKVNGFDERYVDPGTGEDIDLDVRLENAGIIHLKVSRYALMLHRHHDRLDWSAENNKRLLREAQEKKLTYVETGLKRN